MALPRYSIEVRHAELGKYRHISGTDRYVVEQKAAAQRAVWDQQWRVRETFQNRIALKEARVALANQQTLEAEEAIASLKNVLADALSRVDRFDWESLKDRAKFDEPKPVPPVPPAGPDQPFSTDEAFAVRPTLMDRLYPPKLKKKRTSAMARFEVAKAEWLAEMEKLKRLSEAQLRKYDKEFKQWKRRRDNFQDRINQQHKEIDAFRLSYESGDAEAVERYFTTVLDQSDLPECCPQDHQVAIIRDTGTLLIEYRLPAVSDLPRVKRVRYVATRDTNEIAEYRSNEIKGFYDDLIYQLCLSAIHKIYIADRKQNIQSTVFNGWVEFIDPGTGNLTRSCIISLHSGRDEFLKLNLAFVEPKACFRALKGVGAAQLHGMVAVAPLLRMNRADARFVESREVAADIEVGTNVAAIGWEDFEHLIREIFEKEFSRGGGEVKVTRASRDGGVDAVAFDPDPLRGGKIVIQAKRYTNTVDVSAVRDLYGTVMNEGAIKGILVTTSTFGPDAYSFAKDKPLTLMDGGNLLHLLQQHGHPAYIDLAEAKKVNVVPLARTVGRQGEAAG